MAHVLEALSATLSDPGEAGLRRVFVDWVRQLAEPLAPPGAALPPIRTLEELKMTLVERVAEWPKQWLQERALLRRQAALRFGEETAARAAPVLERIANPEGLAAAGDWIVRADAGDELVARLMQLAAGRDTA